MWLIYQWSIVKLHQGASARKGSINIRSSIPTGLNRTYSPKELWGICTTKLRNSIFQYCYCNNWTRTYFTRCRSWNPFSHAKQHPVKKFCYFCGGSLYSNHKNCQAIDTVHHNCSKRGHFAKVYQSKKTSTLNTIFKPSLCAITAACPSSLSHAFLPVSINGLKFHSLIDS